jgi:hypothetical protein
MVALKYSLLLAAFHLSLSLAKVSYNGAKAVRIPVGDDVTTLKDLIHNLSLPTWKGVKDGIPLPNGHVDLVVPADKVAKFEKLAAKMNVEVMHEDLGASIAAESSGISIYAGKFISQGYIQEDSNYS